MKRKCFVVAEPVPNEGISTRKLLLETAYYNVVTAYSAEELLASIDEMPAVDAVVVHSDLLKGVALGDVRNRLGEKPLIVLTPGGDYPATHADVVLPSHQPQILLGKLQEMFGDPVRPSSIHRVR